MQVLIRQENEKDYPEVFKVNRAAFRQDTEAVLVDLLRKSDAFIPELSLVAVSDHVITGHILFTRVSIKSDNGETHESLALAPMAVRPEFQRNGIGAKLINRGLKRAKDLGHKSVVVLGHEHYYPRFGFQPAHRWAIKSTYDVPANAFMAIELIPGGLENVNGTVQYPKEFDQV
jgi:predicted N-acetyltransferase YhbS